MELSFAAKSSPKRPIEEGRKILIPGSLGRCSTGHMNGLSMARPLPLPRFQAWFQAFLKANASRISEMDGRAKAAVPKLDDLGDNGPHFLDIPWREWFFSCGELHISQRSADTLASLGVAGAWQTGLHWKEPRH